MKGRKRYIWLFIGLGVFVLVAGTVAGLTLGGQLPQQQQQITVEQAMESVRRFEGESLPDLKLVTVPDYVREYRFELATAGRSYSVDAVTGEVTGVNYFENGPTSNDVVLSIEQAEARAAAFARQHYVNFHRLTVMERKLLDHGSDKEYSFAWAEVVDGAITQNYVSMRVHPVTGKVLWYVGKYQSIKPFAPPKIARDEAKAIARDAYVDSYKPSARAVNVEAISVADPVLEVILVPLVIGEQHLTWRVDVTEPPQPGQMPQITHRGRFYIDGYTGAVVRKLF